MTKQEAINKVISVSKQYIGYLEKESKENLDDMTKNAGNKNYTKFARDFFPELQGMEWCCMFVYACFAYSFGAITAQNLLAEKKTAKCSILKEAFKNKCLLYYNTPYPGDIIFFKNSSSLVSHCGIVIDITNTTVTTIEGNTSVGNNVLIPNGGGVFKKTYQLTNNRIDSFGRPNWDLIVNNKQEMIQQKDELPKYTNNSIGIINATDVNIRNGAGTNNNIIYRVNKNDEVEILSEEYDRSSKKWYKVLIKKEGYVLSDYVNKVKKI